MQRLKTLVVAAGLTAAALSAEAAPATLAASADRGATAPVAVTKASGVDLSILFGFPQVYAPPRHYHHGHVLSPHHAGRIAAHRYGLRVFSISRNHGYYDVWGHGHDGVRILVQVNAFSGGIHGAKYFHPRPHHGGHKWKHGHRRHHDKYDRGHRRDHGRHGRGHR